MLLPVTAADASLFFLRLRAQQQRSAALTLSSVALARNFFLLLCCARRGQELEWSWIFFLVWEIFLLLLLLRSVSAPTKAVERGNALSRRREWHGTTLFVASIYCPLAFVSNSADVRRDDNVDNKRLGACCRRYEGE